MQESLWERGEYAPQRRATVELLETIFGTGAGELQRLLGYGVSIDKQEDRFSEDRAAAGGPGGPPRGDSAASSASASRRLRMSRSMRSCRCSIASARWFSRSTRPPAWSSTTSTTLSSLPPRTSSRTGEPRPTLQTGCDSPKGPSHIWAGGSMRLVPQRFLGITVATVIGLGVLSGCNAGGKSPTPTSSQSDVSPSTTAAAAPPDDDAVLAFKRQVDYLSKGQFGPEWDELHPAQQAIVPRGLYVQCLSQAAGIEVSDVKIVRTFHERYAIPGTDLEVDSVAITAGLTTAAGQNTTDTYHEVLVDGAWRWVLQGDVAPYAEGNCP